MLSSEINERPAMSAAELRAELGRHCITRKQVAEALGFTPEYIKKILREKRKAPQVRKQITDYIYKIKEKAA
jgi:hypothetical protein